MSEYSIAMSLTADTRALGIELKAGFTGAKLLYRPASAMPFTLAKLLREHKVAVLAVLSASAPDVMWRVAALRPQIPESGPIGRLMVRPDSPTINMIRHCGCCGDPLAEGRRYRCAPCQHAVWLACNTPSEVALAESA